MLNLDSSKKVLREKNKFMVCGLSLILSTLGFVSLTSINISAAIPNSCFVGGHNVVSSTNKTYHLANCINGNLTYNYPTTRIIMPTPTYSFVQNVKFRGDFIGNVDMDQNGTNDLVTRESSSTASRLYIFRTTSNNSNATIWDNEPNEYVHPGYDPADPIKFEMTTYYDQWTPVAIGKFNVQYTVNAGTAISNHAILVVNTQTGQVALDPIYCTSRFNSSLSGLNDRCVAVTAVTQTCNNNQTCGGRKILSAGLGSGAAAQAWKVGAVGDFNGDNKQDLFWRNNVTGETATWLLGGTNNDQLLSSSLLLTVNDPNWVVLGAGEATGDNRDEIFWRHIPSYSNYYWQLNSTGSALQTTQQVVSPGFNVEKVGAF